MSRAEWCNRGLALGLVVGVVVGAGAATAWFTVRERQRTDERIVVNTEADLKRLEAHPVHRFFEEGRKDAARLRCRALAAAVTAYTLNPANVENRPPVKLLTLVQPGIGSSLLENDYADLVDPWGKAYRMEYRKLADGSEYPFIFTTAPDGTRISQFGIGDAAEPKR
jgi:general secretion pathway protein G